MMNGYIFFLTWMSIFQCALLSKVGEESCDKDSVSCQTFSHDGGCEYNVVPLTKVFGARIEGINLATISQECATKIRQESYMHRFLLFKNQSLPWQKQIQVTSLFGTPFEETSSINRKKHDKIPDPRLGFFSNDPEAGLTGVGIEGWHVDGNILEVPHLFTLIYCVSAISNGPTMIVPLKEIVDMLSIKDREYLESVLFVSGFNSSIQIPLLYKHPYTNDDTILLALGSLSGQYRQNTGDQRVPFKQMTVEETQYVQDILLAKIMGSNLIYTVQYEPRDFLMLHNPSVAHLAGPGTQTPADISGLRLMHRSSVRGDFIPTKDSKIEYFCGSFPPFEDGYCLFSLIGSVYHPRIGYFDSQSTARARCKNIDIHSDLAVIYSQEWNDIAGNIVEKTSHPHWLNATNPQEKDVLWKEAIGSFTNWDHVSGQPNDHDGFEGCVVIGPQGKWFDLPCRGPKTAPNADRAPVMVWNGIRDMRNVYPLCGIEKKFLSTSIVK